MTHNKEYATIPVVQGPYKVMQDLYHQQYGVLSIFWIGSSGA